MAEYKIILFTIIFYSLLTVFTLISGINTGIYIQNKNYYDAIEAQNDSVNSLINAAKFVYSLFTFTTDIFIIDILLIVLRIGMLIEIAMIIREFIPNISIF